MKEKIEKVIEDIRKAESILKKVGDLFCELKELQDKYKNKN